MASPSSTSPARLGATVLWYGLWVIGSSLAWKLLPYPLVWCALAGAGVSVFVAIRSGGLLRIAATNATGLAFAVSVLEVVALSGLTRGHMLTPANAVTLTPVTVSDSAWRRAYARPRIEPATWYSFDDGDGGAILYSSQLFDLDEKGEMRLLPGATARAIKTHASAAVYDAVYSVSPAGFRVSRPLPDEAPWPARSELLLLLGCSFTMGTGVDDAETYGSQLQILSEGRYRTLNLGLASGGIHTAVSLLESERERAAVAGAPVSAVLYLAIEDHLRRAVGRSFGQPRQKQPRYVLVDNRPVRLGLFEGRDPPLGFFSPWVMHNLRKSALIYGLMEFAPGAATGLDMWERLVERARDIVQERYHAPLIVVLWEFEPLTEATAIAQLASQPNIVLVSTRGLVPDMSDPRWSIAGDGHPSPAMYELFAAALLAKLDAGTIPIQKHQ